MDINTGPFNDVVAGTFLRDRIDSDGGNDVVFAFSGDDLVHAGDGQDTVFAANGNDIVFGGAGNDSLEGGLGRDLLFGEDGNDTINGFDGNDVLIGGPGTNTLDGGAGDDILLVNPTDTARGGPGADIFFVDLSNFPMVPSLPDFNAAEGDRTVVTDSGELAALVANFVQEANAAGADPNGGGVVFDVAAFSQLLPPDNEAAPPTAADLGGVQTLTNYLQIAPQEFEEMPDLALATNSDFSALLLG